VSPIVYKTGTGVTYEIITTIPRAVSAPVVDPDIIRGCLHNFLPAVASSPGSNIPAAVKRFFELT
jgi:hypothetical protein